MSTDINPVQFGALTAQVKTLETQVEELSAYRDARKLGIQPASTKMKDIQKAVRASDAIGRAAKA